MGLLQWILIIIIISVICYLYMYTKSVEKKYLSKYLIPYNEINKHDVSWINKGRLVLEKDKLINMSYALNITIDDSIRHNIPTIIGINKQYHSKIDEIINLDSKKMILISENRDNKISRTIYVTHKEYDSSSINDEKPIEIGKTLKLLKGDNVDEGTIYLEPILSGKLLDRYVINRCMYDINLYNYFTELILSILESPLKSDNANLNSYTQSTNNGKTTMFNILIRAYNVKVSQFKDIFIKISDYLSINDEMDEWIKNKENSIIEQISFGETEGKFSFSIEYTDK
jgi:hypothetical protein